MTFNLQGEVVYVGTSSGDVKAMRPNEKTYLWSDNISSDDFFTELRYSKRHDMLLGCTRDGNGITARNIEGARDPYYQNSSTMWTQGDARRFYDVVPDGDQVVSQYQYYEAKMGFFDIRDGSLIELKEDIFEGPNAADEYIQTIDCDKDTAYVLGYYGELIAYDLESRTVKWRNTEFSGSGGQRDQMDTSPDHPYVYMKSRNGWVAQINKSDGSSNWEVQSNDGTNWIVTIPRIASNGDPSYFYVGFGNRLEKRNVSDGSHVWTVGAFTDESGEYGFDKMEVEPDGGGVWMTEYNNFNVERVDSDGNITVDTTSSIREFAMGDIAKMVYAGTQNGEVHALGARTGNEAWSVNTGNPILTDLATDENHVYVPEQSSIFYALNRVDGSTNWSHDTGTAEYTDNPVEIGNDAVYTGGDSGTLYALSKSDGSEKWTYSASNGSVDTKPYYTGSFVYATTTQGDVIKLDADTGSEEWVVNAESGAASAPVAKYGNVYVSINAGDLYALNDEDGSEVWSISDVLNGSQGQFEVTAGKIHIAADGDHETYAIDAFDGTVNWTYQSSSDASSGNLDGDVLYAAGHIYVADGDTLHKISGRYGSEEGTDSISNVFTGPGGASKMHKGFYDFDMFIGDDGGNVHRYNWYAGNEWTSSTNGSVYGQPAYYDIKDDRSFEDGQEAVYASADRTPTGMVTGVDDSGRIIWKNVYSNRIFATPTVTDDTLYISADSALLALNSRTGEEEWVYTYDNYTNFNFERGSPIIEKGIVYANSHYGKVHAVDQETGEGIWKFNMDTSGSVYSSLYVGENYVWCGADNGDFYQIDKSDGTRDWKFTNAGDYVGGSPDVKDGVVFFPSGDGNVYAVNIADGTEKWTYSLDSDGNSSVNEYKGVIYTADLNAAIHAINASDGSRKWRSRPTGGTYDSINSSGPTVVDGTVYTAGEGYIFALDASDGSTIFANQEFTEGACGPVTYKNGYIYLVDSYSRVYKYDVNTESIVWRSITGFGAGGVTYGDTIKATGTRTEQEVQGYHDFFRVVPPKEHRVTGKIGMVYVLVQYDGPDNIDPATSSLKIENVDKGNVLFEEQNPSTYAVNNDRLFIVSETAADTEDLSGDRLEVTLNVQSSDEDGGFRLSFGNTVQTDHQHDPEAGIIEKFENAEGATTSFYPGNCDVIVNGTSLGESFGGGNAEFEQVVDVSGMLNPGQVNDIQVTSEFLGHIQAYVEGDVYRQIFGGG